MGLSAKPYTANSRERLLRERCGDPASGKLGRAATKTPLGEVHLEIWRSNPDPKTANSKAHISERGSRVPLELVVIGGDVGESRDLHDYLDAYVSELDWGFIQPAITALSWLSVHPTYVRNLAVWTSVTLKKLIQLSHVEKTRNVVGRCGGWHLKHPDQTNQI